MSDDLSPADLERLRRENDLMALDAYDRGDKKLAWQRAERSAEYAPKRR